MMMLAETQNVCEHHKYDCEIHHQIGEKEQKGFTMAAYKVLLVDDEVQALESIRNKIKWEELGFMVADTATNGAIAMELVEKVQPDVVITDIKMPYVDGLEMAKRLNRDYPNIHIIIFTGFDEFSYAKAAVHLEVEEYLLKPVNAGELSECLRKLKDTLDKEREEKLNVEKLTDYFNNSLPLLQSNFFVSLIEGRVGEKEFDKLLFDYRIAMKAPFYVCVLFHTSTHHVPEGISPLLLAMSVEQEIKKRLAKERECQVFSYLGNTVFVTGLSCENEVTSLIDACDRFCHWAYRIMGAVVTAGVGGAVNRLFHINLSYDGAREALSYRVLYGTKRAISISEIVPQEKETAAETEDTRLHDLFEAIHLGKHDEIVQTATEEVKRLHKNAKNFGQYKMAMMETVSSFYRFCNSNFVDLSDLTGDEHLYEKLLEMDEATLTGWMCDTSLTVADKLKELRNASSRNLVNDAKNIVINRYMDPELSLDTVCSKLGVSNSYFSTVFKKETGTSFVSFLTDYRMSHAMRLLTETGDKSYVIAGKVGYTDANYFSYVFKKQFGMSPSKYRTEHNV